MFQPPAFEVILEFALHVARQFPALRRKTGSERRVIRFDDPIEKRLLGPVALVTTNRPATLGIPCRNGERHDPRTVEPLRVSFSTSSLTLRSSLRDCISVQSISWTPNTAKPDWVWMSSSCRMGGRVDHKNVKTQ